MSQVNRCQAITQAGEQCSRNSIGNKNYCSQHLGILEKLPTDIIPLIGKYTTFQEAKELQEEYRNIGLYKDCAVIMEYTPELLDELYQISPNIKSLEIYFEPQRDFMSVYQKVDLTRFRKLEELKSNVVPNNFIALKNLKTYIIYHRENISSRELDKIFLSIKLEYLEIPWIEHYYNYGTDYSKWISIPSLKELVIENYPKGYMFSNLRRLVYRNAEGEISRRILLEILASTNKLESLELITDSLNEALLNQIYTKNLRHFEIPADLYGGINQLDLPNLEYLSLNNDGDLEMSYLKILELPKLRYLEFIDLQITNEVLNIFIQLKHKIPDLQLNVTDGFNYKKKYMKNIQKISELFNLKIDTEITELYNNKYLKILEPKFSKQQWLQKNGFYIHKECQDKI